MIRLLVVLLLLVATSADSDPSTMANALMNTYSKPTVLRSGCSRDFYGVEWILYSNESVDIINNSPNCISQLPPAAGTLVKTGCSADYPGVQWFVYNDGDGGRYSEKDAKSSECGWEPPTLTLSVVEEFGDAFKPAVIKVDYTNFLGEPEPWGINDSYSTIGHAVRVDRDTVEIYSDTRLGNGIFQLGDEEVQFFIEEEPTCMVQSSVDCLGNRQRGGQDLIYYGEQDDQVVVWELAVLMYRSHYTYGPDVEVGLYEQFDRQSSAWYKWQERVDRYNELYERSGVHIRFELKRLQSAHWHRVSDVPSMMARTDVDIVLGHGWSPPGTCGVARVYKYFREGYPPGSISKCDKYTDLHEIGHSVGLAHGPENQSNSAYGYIFPDFGHGYNDICAQYDDLMSYGSQGMFHSNSLKVCGDIIARTSADMPAGDRLWSDTAYALNRVRYNVSLIHNEHALTQALRKTRTQARTLDSEIIVID